MTFRKKILLILLIIPVTMIIISFGQATVDPGLELVYLVIGVPICILNIWDWFNPEIIDHLFRKG
jgi:hypothetical protein